MDAETVRRLLYAIKYCNVENSVPDALKNGGAQRRTIAIADLKTAIGAAQTLLDIVNSEATYALAAYLERERSRGGRQ